MTDTGSHIFRMQADEATAAQLQRQHNEAEESRQFDALQSKFGMKEKVWAFHRLLQKLCVPLTASRILYGEACASLGSSNGF